LVQTVFIFYFTSSNALIVYIYKKKTFHDADVWGS